MARVAYFVSPHGFGHAARACAVMAALRELRPELHFEVLTEVPKWFFEESLAGGYTYHRFASDVGLVQISPFEEDLAATVDVLDRIRIPDRAMHARVGAMLQNLGCSLVVADISPLGLAAAAAAGVPSVLIENFTWDWIYLNYPGAPQDLLRHGGELAEIFAIAELTIQAEPVCAPRTGAVRVPPVARRPRSSRQDVRAKLQVPASDPMIVVSMGGVEWDYGTFAGLEHEAGAWLVVPGGTSGAAERRGRLILLPFHAEIYHPDLVAASEVVVSKLGYSTVAETYRSGGAFAYISRPRFPESSVLAEWVGKNMVASEIGEERLRSGAWLETADELLRSTPPSRDEADGAAHAAEIILERFGAVFG